MGWSTGWVAGNLVTAAEFGKGVGCIYDTTLVGTPASIDIPGIVATYAHLLIMHSLRGDIAGTGANLWLRFNGAASDMYWQLAGVVNTTFTAAVAAGAAQGMAGDIPGAGNSAGFFGAGQILIPNYGAAADHSYVASAASGDGTAANTVLRQYGGVWAPAVKAAITEITLLPQSGNFVAGSRVTVYGMGA